jgi:3-hydroxyacyl-[acyl-carrier-protein] dehydratase
MSEIEITDGKNGAAVAKTDDSLAKGEATTAKTMDIREIMAILPHRYPMLLIDRVIEMVPRTRIVAIKNVSINEPHFAGHFPDFPIMPGVLIVEAIAQAGGALLLTEIPDRDSKLMVFTGIDSAKFRRPVVPGDQLRIEVTVLNWRSNAVRMKGVVTVDGKVACQAIVMCALTSREPKAAVATGQAGADEAALGGTED